MASTDAASAPSATRLKFQPDAAGGGNTRSLGSAIAAALCVARKKADNYVALG